MSSLTLNGEFTLLCTLIGESSLKNEPGPPKNELKELFEP